MTNLRGPTDRLRLVGNVIDDMIGLGLLAGNVAVGFTVLSYAGQLVVTVVVDPDVAGDPRPIAAALQRELDRLTSTSRLPSGTDTGG